MEYEICKEFGWNPQIFDDNFIEVPSFKDVLKWIFLGRKLKVAQKGIEATKIDKFLTILNEIRIEQDAKQRQIENEAKLRSMIK